MCRDDLIQLTNTEEEKSWGTLRGGRPGRAWGFRGNADRVNIQKQGEVSYMKYPENSLQVLVVGWPGMSLLSTDLLE